MDKLISELPKYGRHEEVYGLKIGRIEYKNKYAIIYPELKKYPPVTVSKHYVLKYDPHIGGYYIVNSNSEISFMSAELFEDKYSLIIKDNQ
jgi:hypothetical protein